MDAIGMVVLVASFLIILAIGGWLLDRMDIDDEDWWLP